jgi:hypothetical protein
MGFISPSDIVDAPVAGAAPQPPQSMLGKIGSGLKQAGQKAGEMYRQDVAAPLTTAVGNFVAHPLDTLAAANAETPAEYQQAASTYTPHDQLPPFAKEVASYVVPQTATGAALTAAAFALPAAGAAKVLGEAAGPVERVLGSRLGRTAAATGIGAATGAATGEGAGQGALQGLGSFGPAEAVGAGAGWLGRQLGEGSLTRQTTAKVGKAIADSLPWIGKMESGSDFADNFIHGGAVRKAGDLLSSVKDTLGKRTMGYNFTVPVPGPNGVTPTGMSFGAADKLISDLQQGYGFTQGGDPRSGMQPREARALAYEIRDRLAAGLDKIQSGLGRSYLKARKQFDAAKTLTDMFDRRDLIGPNGLNQPKLIDRMNEYAPDLNRSLGNGTSKRLLGVLRRGFVGEGKDVLSTAGHKNFNMLGPVPTIHYRFGKSFDPIGEVPGYMRPDMSGIEAGVSNVVSSAMKPEHDEPTYGPAAQALDKSRAEAISPVPSGAARAEKVSAEMRKGKAPEVHKDLNRGRLSLDEVNKLVTHGNKRDAMAMIDNVPIDQVLDAAEIGTPDEKRMLLPMIKTKLQQQFKSPNFNKTMAIALAKRYQKLAMNVESPTPEA